MLKFIFVIFFLLSACAVTYAQEDFDSEMLELLEAEEGGAVGDDSELFDLEDMEDIFAEEAAEKPEGRSEVIKKAQSSDALGEDIDLKEFDRLENSSMSDLLNAENEDFDDLQELEEDVGDLFLEENQPQPKIQRTSRNKNQGKMNLDLDANALVNKPGSSKKSEIQVFDVGKEEKELLNIAKFVQAKIPENEWNEIAKATKSDKYIIAEGDYLWKISQRLFGSGFYYAKIWALNPYITNPHQVEPGMTLVFNTGDETNLPSVKLGSFDNPEGQIEKSVKSGRVLDLSYFGEQVEPPWLKEKSELIKKGIHVQYSSEATYEDLLKVSKKSLVDEYKKYTPPETKIIVDIPAEDYDNSGFDRNSKIQFDVKEGFYLNSFISTNFVQDLGVINSSRMDQNFLQLSDIIYLDLDSSVNAAPGDYFSIYKTEGKVSHPISDRRGYRYTIVGHVQLLRKINNLWEAQINEVAGIIERRDRVTVHTPKINKIFQTFNPRTIEAAVVDSYQEINGFSYGDVVYIDRGRADGVELGNVFEVFSFTDRGTGKKITRDPTYKIGELTVITLTDNFATALVNRSTNEFMTGTLAITKSPEQAARANRLKSRALLKDVQLLEDQALNDLDAELNLEDINEDLLEKADRVQLTEDELEEIERQEREKSILEDNEKDLKELERLEDEIESAEAQLNEAKIDEDQFLEDQSLDDIEANTKFANPNAMEDINELENELGMKYLDENLNEKENPYGLTEYDIEEIDELLNTEEQ